MCIIGLSESGHGGRFEPCEEYKRLLQRSRDLTGNLDNQVEVLEAENAALRQDNQLLRAENARLRATLAPILRHADAHDFAPPLKFSVADCRKIKESLES